MDWAEEVIAKVDAALSLLALAAPMELPRDEADAWWAMVRQEVDKRAARAAAANQNLPET